MIYAKSVNIDTYFKLKYEYLFYDRANAKMLFMSGCRPLEFLNLSISNIDLIHHSITFIQAKDGRVTTRSIDPDFLHEIYDIWRVYGTPHNYYGSYSSLKNYISRVAVPKLQISNRLNDLYAFRYSCCASLLLQGFSESDVITFFNHSNPANTQYYISQAYAINSQM